MCFCAMGDCKEEQALQKEGEDREVLPASERLGASPVQSTVSVMQADRADLAVDHFMAEPLQSSQLLYTKKFFWKLCDEGEQSE